MTLGKRPLDRRKSLNITQQHLAEVTGVTPQHISLLEQNKTTPSISLVAGLAKELGTTTDYLITGEESIITEIIPAIKADKKLSLKAKNTLIALVEEFYKK
jgi:transcriptional regulator with XRE-family HTH domain